MILPEPPEQYSARSERERNLTLQQADLINRKVNTDVEISGERLILTSPDGTRWNITVSNAGAISATSL